MSKKQTKYRPSRLELFPLELRERIYSYLGLPILCRFPATCSCSDWNHNCEDPFHYYHDPEDERNTPFTRSLLTSIRFFSPGRGWESGCGGGKAWFGRVLETSNHEQCEDGVVMYMREYRTIGALICTNKFIAADLYTLLFRKVEVIFNFQLSNKAVFRYHKGWPRGDKILCEGGKLNGNLPPVGKKQVVPYQMQLSPFSFLVMTQITLSDRIGRSFDDEIPHSRKMSYRQRREKLAKQTLSIRLVAQNSPQLKSLTVSSHNERDQGRLKKSFFEAIPFALREAARMCDNLETVNIRILQEPYSIMNGIARKLKRIFFPLGRKELPFQRGAALGIG
ncbi:uncharacterized protein BDZ99DRAFT_543826 [Mytilinidion resinicola]|uniref:F-box domain-containing protein n=1 Tax=Mytilinidion resinicola TaxID=574789 RepID=A0A6A6Y7T3_9PEZI|nr:uncharacterized protein BDZ99DRAFT_543826 [Mytilinidion resinicola]KAF2804901.1 hypothetical protein BDZ99DRAFT_543826 [Mytilinidion resinicola]